jgi:hypothetical protein
MIEVLKQMVEALETAWTYDEDNADGYYFEAIQAGKQAIAELESQEPDIYPEEAYEMGLEAIAYYTHPRTWVGLTKEDKDLIEDLCEMMIGDAAFSTIDAILKGKNT